MTDYQRSVEQASAVYQEVINEYVTENAKLRELVRDAVQAMWACDHDVCVHRCECDEGIEYPRQGDCLIERRARELGIEVDE